MFASGCVFHSAKVNQAGFQRGLMTYRVLKEAEKRHEGCIVAKVLTLKEIKLFGKNWRIDYSASDQYLLSVERTSQQVTKNSAMLARLLDVFCVLENLILALRTSANRENYFDLLKVGIELRCWS
jgi:hypothetical protein